MRKDDVTSQVGQRYAALLREVAARGPADPLDLVARRADAALMADILEELHGDGALAWAERMEVMSKRRTFAKLVRRELAQRLAARGVT